MIALAVPACTHVTQVKGPDGTDWVAVSCTSDMVFCWERAGDECPRGYVMADMRTHVSATGSTVPANSPGFRGEALIKCKDDGEGSDHAAAREAAQREAAQKGESPAGTDQDEDLATCRKAYALVGELAAQWTKERPDRKPAAEPSEATFVAVCRDLPEEAQFCLGVPYRAAHLPACGKTLASLDGRTRRRLDALFLEPE